MKSLLTAEQSGALDASTRESFCIGDDLLMEKASLRMWDLMRRELLDIREDPPDIVAVCGKGDNGGDALAMLRHAYSAGFMKLSVIMSAQTPSPACRLQLQSIQGIGIPVFQWNRAETDAAIRRMRGADFILDGLSGTGLSGEPRGELKEMIDALNLAAADMTAKMTTEGRRRTTVVSVDMPSGVGDSRLGNHACVRADHTLALDPMKLSLFSPESRRVCGRVHCIKDVFPALLTVKAGQARLVEAGDIQGFLTPLLPDDYKMTRGKVAIFAGSVGSAGAARLAARAVQAAGAGYCTLYTDEDAYEVIAPGLDSIIVKPLSSSSFPAISADVILVGPGWGISDSKRILLEKILSTEIPVLIDAGALRILARHPEVLTRRKAACALTPHPGEFSDLAASFGQGGDETTIVALRRLAAAWSCNILFKSHVSLSVTPEGEIDLWDGMTPELGTAGSGDILSGLAAGLAARELCRNRPPGSDHGARIADSLRKALTLAMATHGFAGKNLAESSGWFTAEDILPECARILHDTRIQPQAARLSP